MRKFDIHCHILPKVDDGSSSVEETLKIIRIAFKQGIRGMIVTPHYSAAFPNDDPVRMQKIFLQLESLIARSMPEKFEIHLGQEIFYSDGIWEKLHEGRLLTMAKSDYVLLEFHPATPYSVIYRAVREAVMEQYRPILAHVERYGVLREKDRIEELRDVGAYIQMNYAPVGGKWYHDTTRWCRKMLKKGNVDFLATDTHNSRERRPRTIDAGAWLEARLDEEYLEKIMYKNAESILKNERI